MKSALLLVAIAAVTGMTQQATEPTTPVVAKAEAAVDLLAGREFARLSSQFNATMKSALPDEKLVAIWDGLLAQTGAFVRRTGSTTQAKGVYTAVIVACEFARAKAEVIIVLDGAGEIGGLQIRPLQPTLPYTPPAYAASAAYLEREVTVGTGEWALPGTLTLPRGSGPFPAIVLVHGSGPNDRDETIGPNKVFKDLALGLASRGVAVLRYDKRTRVHAGKLATFKTLTVKEEVVDDALAAIALLKSETSVDSTRIFVLGHSLGGMVAPRIAAADRSLAGIVVMAGAARSLAQAIVDQLQYLAEADGIVSEAERSRIEDAKKTVDAVASLGADDFASGRFISGAPASYWLDLRGYDPPALAASLTTRMLVLQGARDYQVTVADYEKWQAALAGRSNATFRLYPDLNHLFIAGQGKSLPAEYAVAGHVAADVINDIVAWITGIS